MSERIIITLERDYMGQTLRLIRGYRPRLENTKGGEEARILDIITEARAVMNDKIKELQTTKPKLPRVPTSPTINSASSTRPKSFKSASTSWQPLWT